MPKLRHALFTLALAGVASTLVARARAMIDEAPPGPLYPGPDKGAFDAQPIADMAPSPSAAATRPMASTSSGHGTNGLAVGTGTMESVYFGTSTGWGSGSGTGPWIMPQGGDCYLVKHIVHDWGDDRCLTLLGTIARAMDPTGTVVVVDMVMPEGPEPHFAKFGDINMLAFTEGGCERTEWEFATLFDSAGLELKSVRNTPIVSIVEAVKQH